MKVLKTLGVSDVGSEEKALEHMEKLVPSASSPSVVGDTEISAEDAGNKMKDLKS